MRSAARSGAGADGRREHAMIGNLAHHDIVTVMQRMVMVMSLGLAACGGSAHKPPADPQLAASEPSGPGGRHNLGDKDTKCTVEVRTGTSLARPICRSEFEIEEDRRQARELLAHPHPTQR